ncbi:hypothetical protein QO010_000688 [Caulobacter ginsengisoli]|uniref:ATP-dependent endonuclease n=2 Tax=Caulobacter ginsengisoli TaxID=400775 RepID=A0ABU0ILN8_9CAUL|nr:hypothetical protein [Caulobacter ginsengisoli]
MSPTRDRFSIHDFSFESWADIDAWGNAEDGATLPAISLDIWFNVDPANLHRVVDLLPGLAWTGATVGLRIEYAASDPASLLRSFQAARDQARANARPATEGVAAYHPPPRTLREYLAEYLNREFELRYFILDRSRFDNEFVEHVGYSPQPLTPDKGRTGRDILGSLLRVDVLHAQRHLSDAAAGGRAEDLSRRLSRFYEKNLEKRGDDFDALSALAGSEALLNAHLDKVFEPTLTRLARLGYPGLTNPRLLIKSTLNPTTIMSANDGARVHYALSQPVDGSEVPTLPDRYNGLGFKNLIYMVVELLDLHTQWMDTEEKRPPVHLIFIEEPEAHLHAQLQQVFVRKVLDIIAIEGADAQHYGSQLVITTHSPHILYERGFRPIRYFRRVSREEGQASEVLNLSAFYQRTRNPTRDFLERYLKLTHCDLFFADAAVLVEGNVERLLLPQMIAKSAPRLQSAYLSILEIGGAFGHRFKTLIEFLGITTLVITDIDSVLGPAPALVDDEEDEPQPPAAAQAQDAGELHPDQQVGPEPAAEEDEEEEDEDDEAKPGKACMVHQPDAVTSNQTLARWLPGVVAIADLLAASDDQRTQARADGGALVRVTYQSNIDVTWGDETVTIAGRTLEEAFALENLKHCQAKDGASLKLRIPKNTNMTVAQLAERLHKRIKGTWFNKTDFALALLARDPERWDVPSYISDGLRWLEGEVTPPDEVPEAQPAEAADEPEAA